MSFDNKYIFFLCALGLFNCILVSFYFLFFYKQNRTQNFLFGVLTLLLSIKIGKTLYMSFSFEKHLVFAQIGLSACCLIGIVLYYYLKSTIQGSNHLPRVWKLHFIILFLIILFIGLFKPYSENIVFWNDYLVWLIYGLWGGYILMSGFLLKRTWRSSLTTVVKDSTMKIWLALVFVGNVLIYGAYIVGYFWLYLVEMLTFSLVFYTLLIYYLSSKNRKIIFNKVPKKYGANRIEEGELQSMKASLRALMDEEELFKTPDLKLPEVAKKMNVSAHRLSQFLNDNLGVSFSSYINQRRIDKAIQLLKEDDRFTLEAIGYECGFSTKSVFYSTFKKITGQTPSSFRRQIS